MWFPGIQKPINTVLSEYSKCHFLSVLHVNGQTVSIKTQAITYICTWCCMLSHKHYFGFHSHGQNIAT